MKRLLAPLFSVVFLVSCAGKTPNAQFLADANLAITILTTLTNAAAQQPDVSASSINDINASLAVAQKALADVKNGISTPTQFATVASDVVNGLAPTLLTVFKANTDMRSAVALLQGLIPVVAAEVEAAQPPKAGAPLSGDVRMQARAWSERHR